MMCLLAQTSLRLVDCDNWQDVRLTITPRQKCCREVVEDYRQHGQGAKSVDFGAKAMCLRGGHVGIASWSTASFGLIGAFTFIAPERSSLFQSVSLPVVARHVARKVEMYRSWR